jgi:predicted MFS family arabinose efflux permease
VVGLSFKAGLIRLGAASGVNSVVFLITMCVNVGFSASFPFIAVYLIRVRNDPVSQVGVVYLIAGLVSLFGQLTAGRLVDILGAKKMLFIGLAASFLLFVSLLFLVVLNADVLTFLLAYPTLYFFNNLTQVSGSTMVSSQEPKRVVSGLSSMYVGLNLGFSIGPAVSGVLVTLYGYSAAFLVGALSIVAASVAAAAGIKSDAGYASALRVEPSKNTGETGFKRSLAAFLLLTFLSWFSIGYQAIPLSVYTSKFLGFSDEQIGFLLSTNGLLITVLQIPSSKFIGSKARSLVSTLIFGSALTALGFVGVATSKVFSEVELAIVLTTLGEIFTAVPSQIVVTLLSRRHNRGTYQGYYYAASRMGMSLAAYLGPLTLAFFADDPAKAWYIIASVTFLAAAGYALVSRRIRSVYELRRSEE